MAQVVIAQTAFTAGALAPTLRGRRDTQIYQLGCERLENFIVRPQGSALSRPGLRFVALIHAVAGKPGVRLFDFIFDEFQRYVVCVFHGGCKIFRDGDEVLVATLTLPYQAEDLVDLDYVQLADTMLIVHPGYPVRQITRDPGEVWMTDLYHFECPPQFRFHPDPNTKLKITGNLGTASGPESITIKAQEGDNNDVFDPVQEGETWVVAGSRVTIDNVTAPNQADCTLIDTIDSSRLFANQRVKQADWSQQAPADEHGYFRSIAYFQDRLCFGGLRDLPFRIWLSRIAAPFDFQVVNVSGSVDDAEPIQIPVATGRADPIRHLVPGSGGLEVYTTGAEGYMPAGVDQPLTPKTIAYIGQTQFGSRPVKPIRLEAETLFVQLHEGAIRKFVYSNVQQSYSGEPITVRVNNLVDDPVGLAVVPGGFGIQADFVVVVNRDGTGAILSSEPTEQVMAWADLISDRKLVDCKALSNRCYVVTNDGGDRHWLEWLDPQARFDSQTDGFTFTPGVLATNWSGYQNLAGRQVSVWADGYWRESLTVGPDGSFVTARGYLALSIGLPFQPLLRPMPPEPEGGGALLGLPVRPIRCHIRYLASAGIRINGQIIRDRPVDQITDTPPEQTTEDRRVYLRGWRKDGRAAIEVTREGPFRLEVLQLRTEYGVGTG